MLLKNGFGSLEFCRRCAGSPSYLRFIYFENFQDKQSFATIGTGKKFRKESHIMGKAEAAETVPTIRCFVNTGSKPVPLDSGAPSIGCEKLPGNTGLTYGQYLGSVSRLLSENSFQILRKLVTKSQAPIRKLEEATSIELTAEKHGALYSVSRLLLRFPEATRRFAVNCAFSPEQQAFLQVEAKLLAALRARFALPYLPEHYICAEAPGLMLFIAEWFENHHEFHLSHSDSGAPAIKIWEENGSRNVLEEAKIPGLYAQAARILTSYLDPESFSQIYPWHHAAGDFIIDADKSPPSLKLITVRGYRPLLSRESDSHDKMLGALHFFVNLCIRMRIDRLDGVGELAWAGPDCLPGIVCGFREGWETKRQSSTLPGAEEIFSLLLALSPEERLAFAEVVAADGMVEADETEFLLPRLPGCMVELSDTLKEHKS